MIKYTWSWLHTMNVQDLFFNHRKRENKMDAKDFVIKRMLNFGESPTEFFLGVKEGTKELGIIWSNQLEKPDCLHLFDHKNFDYERNAPKNFKEKKYFLKELSWLLYDHGSAKTEYIWDLAEFYETISKRTKLTKNMKKVNVQTLFFSIVDGKIDGILSNTLGKEPLPYEIKEAIYSLILSHHEAGIDVSSPKYQKGIEIMLKKATGDYVAPKGAEK